MTYADGNYKSVKIQDVEPQPWAIMALKTVFTRWETYTLFEKDGVSKLFLATTSSYDWDESKLAYFDTRERHAVYVWDNELETWQVEIESTTSGDVTIDPALFGNVVLSTIEYYDGPYNDLPDVGLITEGGLPVPGFKEDKRFSFYGFLSDYFLLFDDFDFRKIYADPEKIIIFGDDKLVKMEINTPEFQFQSYSTLNGWGYGEDVSKPYTEFYPYTRIYAGSKEKIGPGGEVICPKLKFQLYDDWKAENI